MKSLKELKKVKISPKDSKKTSQTTPEEPSKKDSHSDNELFHAAMSNVKPLKGKGRDIPVETSVSPNNSHKENGELETLNKLVRGEIEFDIEYSDEYIQGYVQGIDAKTFRRFKQGQLSIEAHLDLHGFNSEQAKFELLRFMREQYIQSKKCILLIPGRGKNSPLGSGVLRSEIQAWLTQEPLKRVVLAFCSALPKHGGTGALYVLLRQYKKTKGKIHWDKYLLDLEP